MSETELISSPRPTGSRVALLRFFAEYGFLPLILVLLCLVFGLIEPLFLTPANLSNVVEQSSYLIVFALAQMFVLLPRGFDLSLGMVVSTASVIGAMVMVAVAPGAGALVAMTTGMLAALTVGAAAGAVNGSSVAYLGVNPFVATLGMQGIAFGIATTISGGFPVTGLPEQLVDTFGQTDAWFGVVSPPVGVCVILLVLAYGLLNHTVFGRGLYLIGASPRAAELAGLPWRRITMLAYVLCGVVAAVGALLITARTGTGEPNTSGGIVLLSIAAAVAGGVSLQGGEGRIIHVILGGILVSVLSVGMNLSRIDGFLQDVVLGVVVIVAVFLDRLRLRIRV